MNRPVSTKRLKEIADEVFNLIGANDVFDFIDDSIGNTQAVENRLQEVMMSRQSFECLELAMYLRTTCSRRGDLPTWQPLCNATIELCRMRGEPLEMLYGLIPHEQSLHRNTGQLVYRHN